MANQNLECSVCHRSFKTPSGLSGHVQWKHPELVGAGPVSVASPDITEQYQLTDEDRRLFRKYGFEIPDSPDDSKTVAGRNGFSGSENGEAPMALTDEEKVAGGFVGIVAPIVGVGGAPGDSGATHHLCDDTGCDACQAALRNYAHQVLEAHLLVPGVAKAEEFAYWGANVRAKGKAAVDSWEDVPGVAERILEYQVNVASDEQLVRITF